MIKISFLVMMTMTSIEECLKKKADLLALYQWTYTQSLSTGLREEKDLALIIKFINILRPIKKDLRNLMISFLNTGHTPQL